MGFELKALGDLAGGEAEAGAADFRAQVARNNATIALRNADTADAAGAVRAEAQGLKTRAAVGAIKTAQAVNGIDVNSGSAVDVRQSQSMLGMLDALTIRSNAARQAFGLQTEASSDEAQATLDKAQASQARTASYIQLGNDFLSSAKSAASAGAGGGGGGSALWE